ncbi:MAG: UDP-N-acetylglucosamine 2-epimerase [Myxococcota bacterium]|nr:UDP-N-acetylglucosamine 2-epimerase [Myxococcota bacterium]MEC9390040.1 UDP-N-acetylglucosamine 2-epimerase [Myxococcota bacterium]
MSITAIDDKKSILFVTGTRADFGKMKPLAIAARDAGHAVTFFVTGMHMLRRYGLTKLEVARVEGVERSEFVNQQEGDSQDRILASTVTGFSAYIAEERPDLVVVHGDRVEALATSLVCAINYVRCLHVEGGEVSGTIDEIYRHCNTKLCTGHLVSSEAARRRVVRLGETPERVFVMGSPELDAHLRPSGVTLDEVREHYGIPWADYGIAIFHPVTSEAETMGEQARELFGALEESGRNFVVIAPNNDPGSEAIFDVINALPESRFRLIPSMRFAYFSELLRNAGVMVGNSSAGVREAPFLGLPSLDVGTRQTNRSTSVSITPAAATQKAVIKRFLSETWGHRFPSDSAFGEGNAANRFVEILESDALWALPKQKQFFDGEATLSPLPQLAS